MHLVHCLKHGGWTIYSAISGYLKQGTYVKYPAMITQSQKFILRRSCKNYKLLKGKLYYKEYIQDGTERDRLVVKRNEADRDFLKYTDQ